MASVVTGGCRCGAIRYECSAEPLLVANCYCTDCQKATGGAMASVMVVPKASFKLLKGQPKQHEVIADSGKKIRRAFCPECGSRLFAMPDLMPDAVSVNLGNLDEPGRFKPTMAIYASSALPWAAIPADLQKFAKLPPLG